MPRINFLWCGIGSEMTQSVSIGLIIKNSQESVNEVITQINNVLNCTVSQVGLAQNIGFDTNGEVKNFDISILLKMNCKKATEIKEDITKMPFQNRPVVASWCL